MCVFNFYAARRDFNTTIPRKGSTASSGSRDRSSSFRNVFRRSVTDQEKQGKSHRRTASGASGRSYETGEDAAAALSRSSPAHDNGNKKKSDAVERPLLAHLDNIEFIDQDEPVASKTKKGWVTNEDEPKAKSKLKTTAKKKQRKGKMSSDEVEAAAGHSKKDEVTVKNSKTTTDTKR